MSPRSTPRFRPVLLVLLTTAVLYSGGASAELFRRRGGGGGAPPSEYVPDTRKAPPVTPASGTSSFLGLSEILTKAKAKSVDDAVSLLPASLFNDYVLMRDSGSGQEATPDKPREILFGGGGDLIVAVGGHGDSIEAIEYDKKNRRWDFYEISFTDGKPTVSERNPKRCTGCHGEPLRPNWETYLLWPGSYGERDGLLGADADDFKRFARAATRMPRYSRLVGLADHYKSSDDALDPNTRFTITVTKRNMERVANELTDSPAFPSLKYAVLAAVAGCGETASGTPKLPFLPEDSELRKRAEALVAKKLKEHHKDGEGPPLDLFVLEAVLEASGIPWSTANASTVSSLKKLYERARKERTSYDPFSHGFGGIELFADWGLAAVDKDLEKIVAAARTPYSTKRVTAPNRAQLLSQPYFAMSFATTEKLRALCKKLEPLSKQALKGFTPPMASGARAPKPSLSVPSHQPTAQRSLRDSASR